MKYAEFAERITETYHGKFRHSACVVKGGKYLGRTIWIDCYLAENANEMPHGYKENDMFKISFKISLPDKFDFETDNLPDTMTLENSSKHYAIKPESVYLYYDRRNLTYRKTMGNAEKLITAFEKFVDRLYNSVCEDIESGNIHDEFAEILNTKI